MQTSVDSTSSPEPEAEDPQAEEEIEEDGILDETAIEEAEAEAWPEAGPEWDAAWEEWAEAWPVHVYVFAVSFLLLSALSAYLALTSVLQRSRGSSSRLSSMGRTTLALNLMVFTFCATRALVLFADPYYSEKQLPFLAARLLWSLGLPGFTASFSIMLLILLDTTKMSLAPPRFQSVGTVCVIWLLHVLVVTLTDLLVMYVRDDVRPLLMMCQMLFVTYGLLVGAGYAYVGLKMRANVLASAHGQPEDEQTKRIRRLVSMTFMSSAVALSVATVNVYTAVSQFGPYAEVDFVPPWTFWGVHTLSRSLEAAACTLVLTLFLRSGSGSGSGSRRLFCNKCCLRRIHHQSVSPGSASDLSRTAAVEVTGLQWRKRDNSSLPEAQL